MHVGVLHADIGVRYLYIVGTVGTVEINIHLITRKQCMHTRALPEGMCTPVVTTFACIIDGQEYLR